MIRERIQTGIVVTLASALIWLYAEAQNPAPLVRTEITLQIRAPQASDLNVRQGSTINVSVMVAGATGEVRKLENQLDLDAIRLTLGDQNLPATPGRHTQPTLPLLEQHPVFAQLRVRLRDPEPAVIEYTVERIVERSLEVVAASFGTVAVEGPVEIDPPTVTVRMSEATLQSLDASSLRVEATPRLDTLPGLRPGDAYTVDATLAVPGVADPSLLTFTPSRVRMTFAVRSTRVETVKRNVPVHFVIPPLDQERYVIEIEEAIIPELRLAGPSHLIDQIDSGEIRVTGQLLLSSDDLATRIESKEVSFLHLPAEIEVVAEEPVVARITVTRRESGGSGS